MYCLQLVECDAVPAGERPSGGCWVLDIVLWGNGKKRGEETLELPTVLDTVLWGNGGRNPGTARDEATAASCNMASITQPCKLESR